jgi:hypothetical protein
MCGSSSRALALQGQDPEVKPSTIKKKNSNLKMFLKAKFV